MKRVALIAAGAIVALAGASAGAAFYLRPSFLFGSAGTTDATQQAADAPAPPSPESLLGLKRRAVTLLEKLALVQDRIARGDRSALAEQRQLLAETGSAIRYFEKRDWQDFANVRAGFLYVLSGGDPNVLKPFIAGDVASDADRKLADGIAYFAKGQNDKASKLLDVIDPRALDTSIVGPFALARGSIHIADNPAAAITYLDEARLASPHTAIEEAALRREIPLLTTTGQTDRAIILAADYVHRFGKSIYARKLFANFSGLLATRSELNEASTYDRLSNALNPKDTSANADFLLEVAGQSLLRGRLIMTKKAAAEVLTNSSTSQSGLDKAKLYQAAADAPSGRAGEALRLLGNIAADKLSNDDAEILDAADYIAREVADGTEAADHAKTTTAENLQFIKANTNESSPIGKDLLRLSGALNDADSAMNEVDHPAVRAAK